MDWALAITHNRDQLLRILAALFAMAGLADGGTVSALPRHLYRAVLLVLKPAESAVRRLVIIAARGLVLKTPAARFVKKGSHPFPQITAPTVPAFSLIDPRKKFAPDDFVWGQVKTIPHIRTFGSYEPLFAPLWPPVDPARQAPNANDPLNASGLCRRLLALKSALNDLPKQARRMARLDARRDVACQSLVPHRPGLLPTCRPGRPPGLRKRPVREVDQVLRECHQLAMEVIEERYRL